MKAVSKSIGLYSRGGLFYFRKAIPARARHIFGGKREFVRSLKTGYRPDAERLARQLHTSFDQKIATVDAARLALGKEQNATCCNLSSEYAEQLARESLSDFMNRFRSGIWEGMPKDIADLRRKKRLVADMLEKTETALALRDYRLVRNYVDELNESRNLQVTSDSAGRVVLENRVFRARLEALRRYQLQLDGRPTSAVFDELFATEPIANIGNDATGISIGELFEKFAETRAPSWSVKTRAKYDGVMRVAKSYFQASTPAISVTRADCRGFMDDILRYLPPNWGKNRALAKVDVTHAAKVARDKGLTPMHPKTQREYLRVLHGIFRWAHVEEYIAVVPTAGLNVVMPKGYKRQKTRGPFNISDLTRIFSTPLYTGCVDGERGYAKRGTCRPRNARFWVPLIALYSGMRLNEIVSLRGSDIALDDDIWVIRVLEDIEAGKELKTASSERIIPIHKELVALGFPEFVQEKVAEGVTLLFPEIKASGGRRPSDNFSQWFGRFLSSADVKSPSLNFHSFRHSFRDRLREADLSVEKIKALGGWASTEVHEGYGKGYSVSTLKEAIDQVEYPGLTLSHLHQ